VPVLRSRLEDTEVPYAVVGHSMGCWAAYEFLVRVQACALPLPTVFCVACFPPPDLSMDDRPWRKSRLLGEDAFQEECRTWDINPSVFRPGIWEAFQPMLRADFQLFDEYVHEGEGPGGAVFQCPIVGYAAQNDRYISRELVEGWGRFSSVSFTMPPCITGHHLFVFDDVHKEAWFGHLANEVAARHSALPPTPRSVVKAGLVPPPPGTFTETESPISAPAEVHPDSATPSSLPSSRRPPKRLLCLHGMGTCGKC
jgi:surfactin synthase thioesterase subunit